MTNVSFKPLALWEITDEPDSLSVCSSLSELPTNSGLHAEWNQNASAHQQYVLQLQKERKGRSRKFAIPLIAILTALVIAFPMTFVIMDRNSNFDLGCKMVSWLDPSGAHSEYFAKPPHSYHERIAEEYIQKADELLTDGFTLIDLSLELLDYAATYAQTDVQKQRISHLRVQAHIGSNEEGRAKSFIGQQYQAGQFTAEQVVDFAVRMRNLVPKGAQYDVVNHLQSDALALVQLVSHGNETAARLNEEWKQRPNHRPPPVCTLDAQARQRYNVLCCV